VVARPQLLRRCPQAASRSPLPSAISTSGAPSMHEPRHRSGGGERPLPFLGAQGFGEGHQRVKVATHSGRPRPIVREIGCTSISHRTESCCSFENSLRSSAGSPLDVAGLADHEHRDGTRSALGVSRLRSGDRWFVPQAIPRRRSSDARVRGGGPRVPGVGSSRRVASRAPPGSRSRPGPCPGVSC
jgi:hypothetical protein